MPAIIKLVDIGEPYPEMDRVIYSITVQDIKERYDGILKNYDRTMTPWDELSDRVKEDMFSEITDGLILDDSIDMVLGDVITEGILKYGHLGA